MIQVMRKAQELAEAIAASDVYSALKAARAAVDADPEASGLLARWEETGRAARQALREAAPDAAAQLRAFQALQREVDDNDLIRRLRTCRQNFDDMLESVNQVLLEEVGAGREGEAPSGSGGCAGCAGCSRKS